jgi:beta-galactosidase
LPEKSQKGINYKIQIGFTIIAVCLCANTNGWKQTDNLQFPISTKEKFRRESNKYIVDCWVFSPRPLNDLLIEPDMPKLTLYVDAWQSALLLNDKPYEAANKTNRNSTYKELPLLQGWNKLTLRIGTEDRNRFNADFRCENNLAFLLQLKVSFTNPEVK